MSDLATLRGRVAAVLGDSSNVRYSTDLLAEALRSAVEEYSAAYPQIKEAVHTATAGRQQTLTGFEDLQHILRIDFPYDSSDENQQPYAYGYYHYWRNGAVMLELFNGSQVPQAGDSIRIVYAAPHTLKDLDSAIVTSFPPQHFTPLVHGAAGKAALTRAQNMIEAYGQRSDESNKLKEWANAELMVFAHFLTALSNMPAPGPTNGLPGQRWKLDEFDL